MINTDDYRIDEATISKLGLKISEKAINAPIAPHARVFEYPHLDDVFVMESDLYGNLMPEGSCFLAFNGHHGLIGKHLKVETLKHSSEDDIKNLVDRNKEG